MVYLLPTTNNTVQVVFGAGLTTYGGNISGAQTQSTTINNIGAVEVDLIINVSSTVSGTNPTLTFTLSEIDPGTLTSAVGTSVTGAAITTGTTTQTIKLSNTTTGAVKIAFTVGGTTPVFNGVYATLVFRTLPTNGPSIPINVLTGTSGAINVGSNLSTNLLNAGLGAGIYGPFLNKEINLTINATSFSTLTALTFTMSEVDPQNTGTTLGTSVAGVTLTVAGTQLLKLADTTTGYVKITYTATGTAGTNTVFVTLTTKQTEDIIEQYAPVAEDNVNGVVAQAVKPLAIATYSPLFTDGYQTLPGNIKGSTGNVFSIYVSNASAAARYVCLFNSTGAPSGTPTLFFLVPAGTVASPSILKIGTEVFTQSGINFATGITLGISTGGGTYAAATAGDHSWAIVYI